MADIFISYAREDADKAKMLAQELERRGWSVWWDRKLVGGMQYRQVIKRELETCRCVVVLWSKISADSQWVHDEAEVGEDRGKLVHIIIDERTRIPLGFGGIKADSLLTWKPRINRHDIDIVILSISKYIPIPKINFADTSPKNIPADIFINYAKEDSEKAKTLANELEQRGWSVCCNMPLNNTSQNRHQAKIEVENALCIVVLWSKASENFYLVHDVAEIGRERGNLVPIIVESGTKIPLGFGGIQAESVLDWKSGISRKDINKIISSISRLASNRNQSAAITPKYNALPIKILAITSLISVAVILSVFFLEPTKKTAEISGEMNPVATSKNDTEPNLNSIVIDSAPSNADFYLYINGYEINHGKTPFKLQATLGQEVQLKIAKEGYRARSITFKTSINKNNYNIALDKDE
jgi:hypothetical protein